MNHKYNNSIIVAVGLTHTTKYIQNQLAPYINTINSRCANLGYQVIVRSNIHLSQMGGLELAYDLETIEVPSHARKGVNGDHEHEQRRKPIGNIVHGPRTQMNILALSVPRHQSRFLLECKELRVSDVISDNRIHGNVRGGMATSNGDGVKGFLGYKLSIHKVGCFCQSS